MLLRKQSFRKPVPDSENRSATRETASAQTSSYSSCLVRDDIGPRLLCLALIYGGLQITISIRFYIFVWSLHLSLPNQALVARGRPSRQRSPSPNYSRGPSLSSRVLNPSIKLLGGRRLSRSEGPGPRPRTGDCDAIRICISPYI